MAGCSQGELAWGWEQPPKIWSNATRKWRKEVIRNEAKYYKVSAQIAAALTLDWLPRNYKKDSSNKFKVPNSGN